MVKGLLVLLVLMVLSVLWAGSLVANVEAKKTAAKTCTVETVGTPDCNR